MRAPLIALLCLSSLGHAKSHYRQLPLVRVAQKPEVAAPAAGTCVYRQPGVKFCSVLPDGQGVFNVFTAWPGYLHIRFDDPVDSFVVPDPKFFQAGKRGNTVTIIPIARSVPGRNFQATMTTATATVTLNIEASASGHGDAQITIVDPARSDRQIANQAIETRAEKRAAEISDMRLLDELTAAALTLRSARGNTIARNSNLIVLRTRDVLQIGKKTILTFSIENKSAEPFDAKKVRFWLGNQEQSPLTHLVHNPINPNEEVIGAVSIEGPIQTKKCRLLVEESDTRRNIELAKLELP